MKIYVSILVLTFNSNLFIGGDSSDFDSPEKEDLEELKTLAASPFYADDDNPNTSSDFESKPANRDSDYDNMNKPSHYSKKRYPKLDQFWDHPIVNLPPRWENKDREPEQPRYPLYDPSYPTWEMGYPNRPGNKKNIFKFIPTANYLKIDPGELQGRLKQQLAGQVDDRNDPNKMSSGEVQRYKDEIKVGDLTQLLGTNLHIHQPSQYRWTDLGRRFIVQKINDKEHKTRDPNIEVNSIIPKLATPEIVLAVAKESARLEASKPVDPNQYTEKNKALRSNNFWNSFWKEDMADLHALRSGQPEKMESLKVKLSPGTPIYEYFAKLDKKNPKLLYVINKKE